MASVTSPVVAALSSSLIESTRNISNATLTTPTNTTDNMKDDDVLDVIILILKASIMVIWS